MPMYMFMDSRKNFATVYVEAETPMEIEVMPGFNATGEATFSLSSGKAIALVLSVKSPVVVFRSMGGPLSFHFFTGPTPRDVLDQLTGFLGRPQVPPRWAMGYHMCRAAGGQSAFEVSGFLAGY